MKVPCYTSINYSVVHNLICKVNKKLALRLPDPMALRVLLSATVLEVSLRSFYFSNFANGSERKRLSAFTGKFPSSTAGLDLVLNTSCLIKSAIFWSKVFMR